MNFATGALLALFVAEGAAESYFGSFFKSSATPEVSDLYGEMNANILFEIG